MKYLLFTVFVIIFSCTKEQNNPYDRECPSEIWSPTSLTASPGANGVTLSWEQQANHFDGFLMERSTDSLNWVTVNATLIDKSERNYLDSDNLPGGKMYYRISAKADKNQSNYSYAKSICLVPATPGAITGKTTVQQNETGVIYSIVPVSGATTYTWTKPADATIVSGQGTIRITINFGVYGGNISVQPENSCGKSNSINLTITISQGGNCNYGNMTDSRDGRTYRTIQIGSQVWMAENLTWLPSVNPPTVGSYTVPYYYVYDYSGTDVNAAKTTQNYSTYGVLYNWKAALTACPAGWHLPSDMEWTTLTNYLINNGYGYGGIGDNITKSMAASTNWDFSSTPGTPGNDLGSNNSSCFSGLPCGHRTTLLDFRAIGIFGNWWSSTEFTLSPNWAWYRSIQYNRTQIDRLITMWDYGYNIRCVKD